MLEDLGNIGDFVGGIAVIATLIYLAIQVRQNTVQLKESSTLASLQARDAAFQAFTQFREKIIANADVAEIYLKGLHDPSQLEQVDRLRFNLLANELFYLLQTGVDRVVRVDSADVDKVFRDLGIVSILKAPGLITWWQRNREDFDPAFVASMDSQIAARASDA